MDGGGISTQTNEHLKSIREELDEEKTSSNNRSTSIGDGFNNDQNRPSSRASNSSSSSKWHTGLNRPSETTTDTIAEAQSSMFECDRVSLNSVGASASATACAQHSQHKPPNISTTAFSTFVRLIQSLGPVLTCKYCCSDLFKMLAICYMNSRCLLLVENSGTRKSCRFFRYEFFTDFYI